MKQKRVIALLLAGCMALGLTGCIQKSESGAGKNEKKEAVEAPEGIWDPYKEPVTVTTVLAENAGIKWDEGDDYDNNPWYREYKKRFNIDMKNAWVSNDYSTKLNLNIADGDIPDVFAVNASQLKQLQEADLIWDMTEVFDKYASDTVKDYMKQEAATFETGKFDGKLYGIPQLSYGNIGYMPELWIRADWKEEQKLEDPKTMDDMVAMAKTFMEAYGGYGFTENNSLSCFMTLASGWGAHPGIWLEGKDGKLEYGSIQPEMKNALEDYAEWYKEGIINPEFAVSDYEKMEQDVLNGQVGMTTDFMWWGVGAGLVENYGEEALFDAYRVPSADGAEVKGSVSFNNLGYIVVSKKCKNPEAIMKMIDLYVYLAEGGDGTEDQEVLNKMFGTYANLANAVRIINPQTDYNQFDKIQKALKTKDEADINAMSGNDLAKYNFIVDYIENGNTDFVGTYMQCGKEKCKYSVDKVMIDNGEYINDALWGLPTDTLAQAGDTLDSILIEGFTKIIVGEESIDYFDQIVEDWKNAGGEKATEEVNEVYGK